jgi:ankyrin repeat protein
LCISNFEVVKILVERGADVNNVIPHISPLRVLLRNESDNRLEIANYLTKTSDGSLIHNAACSNNILLIYYLIGKKVNVNEIGKNNRSPLIRASMGGSKEAILVLLKNGADKYLNYKSGKTAIDYAIEHKYSEIIELLK